MTVQASAAVNVGARPDVAVAATVKSASPNVLPTSGSKLIVWATRMIDRVAATAALFAPDSPRPHREPASPPGVAAVVVTVIVDVRVVPALFEGHEPSVVNVADAPAGSPMAPILP